MDVCIGMVLYRGLVNVVPSVSVRGTGCFSVCFVWYCDVSTFVGFTLSRCVDVRNILLRSDEGCTRVVSVL